MPEYTITISEEEEKALLTNMVDIQVWLQNAITQKARKVTDRIVVAVSDKNPKKISQAEKAQIIRDAALETATERNFRIEAQLGPK